MAHRDICCTVTGMIDFTNRSLISCSKSVPDDGKYFGCPIPEMPEGFARIDVKMGYHFLQYLGPKKTRYISIWNTDPKIDYIPSMLLNYAMTNVLYTQMTNMQQFSHKLSDPEIDPEVYKYYARKKPYYEWLLRFVREPCRTLREEPLVSTKDCPDHPAHPDHPDHDPAKKYW